MNSNRHLEGEEFGDRIRQAFDHQSIPPRPADIDMMNRIQASPASQTTFGSWFSSERSAQWMATVSVVLVGSVLALAFWRSSEGTIKAETERDTIVQPDINESIGPVVDLITGPVAVDPSATTPAQQPAVKAAQQSNLLQAFTVMNDCVRSRQNNPRQLARLFGRYMSEDSRDNFEAAIKVMGVPRGITRVSEDLDASRAWMRGADETAFLYQVNFSQFIRDCDPFVTAMFGDPILEPMLDGIRDDAEGPKIDIRGNVFPRMKSQCIVVLNQKPTADGVDRLVVVFPIRDQKFFAELLRRIDKVEPDGAIQNYRNTAMMIFPRPDTAACVIDDNFVIGDLKLIRGMLDRRLN